MVPASTGGGVHARTCSPNGAHGALVAWLRRLVALANTKRALIEGLAFNPGAYPAAHDALYAAGGPLIARAQEADAIDPDLDIDDVMRFAIGVSVGLYRDDAQRERISQVAMTGLVGSPGSRRPTRSRR
jgi:hypothetical protein